MPDFIPTLIVGVSILVVLLIVFGGIFGPSPFPGRLTSSKTIDLGKDFTVSYTTGTADVVSTSGEIARGLFAGQDKGIAFDISNPSDATEGILKLNVKNTNLYGSMIIRLNGNEIYRGFPRIGNHSIRFGGRNFTGSNVLDFIAESSGWRIWAPTVYTFDSSVTVDYIGKQSQTFNFNITNLELTNTARARIVVFADRQGINDFIVRINDVEIFRGLTNVFTDFPVDVLKEGTNTVEMSAEPNTTYRVSNAQIILFF